MTALKLVMTTAGLARFTAAQASDDIDLTIASVGLTAADFVAAPTLTALPGEFRRLTTVAGSVEAQNIVHLTVTDSDAVTYRVTGFGLFLADGTLFAAYSQPGTIVEKSVGSMVALAIDVAFPAAGVEQLTFGDTNFLNPPATTARKGVVRIASDALIDAGLSALDAVTPAGLRRALPIGIVTLWFGNAASVPIGWAICNGQSVARSDGLGNVTTPDLVDRVAVGAGAHPVGAAFGASSHTNDTGSAGGHTPSGKVPDLVATTTKNGTGIDLSFTRKTETAGGGTDNTVKTVTVNDPGHTHDVSITSRPALLMDPVEGHTHAVTVDVTQPSLALHYIMKV